MASPSELQSSFDLGSPPAATRVRVVPGLPGARVRARAAERPSRRPQSSDAAARPQQEWFTAKEAADYARLSVKALYQRRERGQLKAYTMGHGRALRFRRPELDALMTPDGRP
jgi:excisionase family DNA binding protein